MCACVCVCVCVCVWLCLCVCVCVCVTPGPPPPPPTQYYLGTHMLVPSLWKHPPISGLTTFLNPPFAGFSQAFPALETPLNPKHCSMYPPIFYFITPFLNFSGVQRERERKTTPFLKKSPGEKSNNPPFLQYSRARTLSHEKYPFTGDFGNTHAVPPTPEWGGGGGGVLLSNRYHSERCFGGVLSLFSS